VHVIIDRDWLDYFALAAGVVGSLFAGVARFVAGRPLRDIVTDRREIVELIVPRDPAGRFAADPRGPSEVSTVRDSCRPTG
jgi:hypothetical protein